MPCADFATTGGIHASVSSHRPTRKLGTSEHADAIAGWTEKAARGCPAREQGREVCPLCPMTAHMSFFLTRCSRMIERLILISTYDRMFDTDIYMIERLILIYTYDRTFDTDVYRAMKERVEGPVIFRSCCFSRSEPPLCSLALMCLLVGRYPWDRLLLCTNKIPQVRLWERQWGARPTVVT